MKPKKKDTSAKIHQGEKLKTELRLRQFEWTAKQAALIELIAHKDTNIVFVKGPAGSAKTSTTMFSALNLLNQKKISDILLIRSVVESADSKMGFLPGDLNEKFGVYMTPFQEKLSAFLCPEQIKMLETEKRLVATPVNFMRGMEFNVKAAIADEAQNMTLNELQTIMTRFGQHSKLMICADPDQSDLPSNKRGGFETLWDLFRTHESEDQGIFCVEFEELDILRSEVVRHVVSKFKELRK